MKKASPRSKEFDTVKTFRKIKDKISNDIKNMSFDELQAYLETNKLTVLSKNESS